MPVSRTSLTARIRARLRSMGSGLREEAAIEGSNPQRTVGGTTSPQNPSFQRPWWHDSATLVAALWREQEARQIEEIKTKGLVTSPPAMRTNLYTCSRFVVAGPVSGAPGIVSCCADCHSGLQNQGVEKSEVQEYK